MLKTNNFKYWILQKVTLCSIYTQKKKTKKENTNEI